MLTTDAIKYFGSKRKIAESSVVKAPTVYAWGRLVPEGKAARLSLITNGDLIYDPNAYQQAKSA